MTRRHVIVAVQLAGTALLLWLLFRRFDWREFGSTLRAVSPWFFASALAAVTAGQLLYAWRWKTVLEGLGFEVAYRDVLRQYFIGLFFGNLAPTAVGGDAAKVYYLGRTLGYVEVGASVFVDRFLGFFWLSVFGTSLAWYAGAPSPLLAVSRSLLTTLAIAFGGILLAVRLVPVERLVPGALRRGRLGGVVAGVERFAGFVQRGGCRPRTLLVSGGVVLVYAALTALLYAAYFDMAGAPAGLPAVMSSVVSLSVLVNVPISLNGIGLREQLHYLLFTAIGVPKETSVSLALIVFGCSLALSVLGYGAWLQARPSAKGASS